MPSPQAILTSLHFRDICMKHKDMEMLTFLSRQLSSQSLNEGRPFTPVECDGEVEERDSGTESDEDNAELHLIESQGSPGWEGAGHLSSLGSSPPLPVIKTASGSAAHYVPPHSRLSPVISLTKKRPIQLVKQHRPATGAFQAVEANTFRKRPSAAVTPEVSSDFERCSLDYEPNSSTEFDPNSSEEELGVINCSDKPESHAEKRKWSQMSRCGSCSYGSASSDDEVRDLLACSEERYTNSPLVFSSSPPRDVRHLRTRLTPPKVFLARLSPGPIQTVCSVSPRKRHRQLGCSDVSEASVIPRPCLDFDKMRVSAPHLLLPVFLH